MPNREKAVLVGVGLKGDARLMESSLEELKRLSDTAGAEVDGVFSQALERYQPGTLIGTGKVDEIAQAVKASKAKTVIFDVEISPAQQKNLERAIKAKILDRTRLILDIFAQRAKTSEGRLQVELAQLSYMLPRLTGAWRSYSQQVGGIGTRGPGERQLEYERRHIQRRILHLKHELETVRKSRDVRRARRLAVPVPQIALVGYTNVGKSTFLNSLAKHSPPVLADDKLFATLDPTSRRVRLPGGGWAVFTDTVGFIQRLPTALVAAFRSTLEEAKLADCLLILSDSSAPNREEQEKAVEETLADLGADKIPSLKIFNKADLLSPDHRRDLARRHPEAVFACARTGEGLDAVLAKVEELLSTRWILRELTIPVSASRLSNEIYAAAQVLSERFEGHKIRYRLRLTPENWQRLHSRLDGKNLRG